MTAPLTFTGGSPILGRSAAKDDLKEVDLKPLGAQLGGGDVDRPGPGVRDVALEGDQACVKGFTGGVGILVKNQKQKGHQVEGGEAVDQGLGGVFSFHGDPQLNARMRSLGALYHAGGRL